METSSARNTYPKPALTADVIVLALAPAGLQVLLIRRGNDPFLGRWALPGGFCEPAESIEQAAARELEEETGVRGVRLEQVHTFTAPGRDPRGWTVSVAHLALLPAARLAEAKGADDAAEARFWPIRREGAAYRLGPAEAPLGPLAFDHDEILAKSLAHLVRDAETFAPELLNEPFTRADLAEARGAILALGGAAPAGRG